MFNLLDDILSQSSKVFEWYGNYAKHDIMPKNDAIKRVVPCREVPGAMYDRLMKLKLNQLE